jgi:DNA replication protein DnaC
MTRTLQGSTDRRCCSLAITPGTGKSHLPIATGTAVAERGHRVKLGPRRSSDR